MVRKIYIQSIEEKEYCYSLIEIHGQFVNLHKHIFLKLEINKIF